MAKKWTIFIFAVLLAGLAAGEANAGVELLTDGFVATGLDGKVVAGGGEKLFFKFDSDVNDGRSLVKAGTEVEMLRSAALGKMTADIKKQPASGYRLWGRITKYGSKNFIFPIYCLPLAEVEQKKPAEEKTPQKEGRIAINEPNDVLTIPNEIMAKLQKRRIIQTEQLQKGLELKQDSILVDRVGFIRTCGAKDTQYEFVLDAIGRNVGQISFRLLACEAMELAERQAEAEPIRFKAAGIVTKYKGQYYLLLERATRVYSYGNFGN